MFFKQTIIANNDTDEISIEHKIKYSTSISIPNTTLPTKMKVVIKNRLGEIDWEGYCINSYIEAMLTYAIEHTDKQPDILAPYSMEIDTGSKTVLVPISVNINLGEIPFVLKKPTVVITDDLIVSDIKDINRQTEYLGMLLRKVLLALGKDLRETPITIVSNDGSQKMTL